MHLSRPRRSPWRDLVLVASLLAYGICQASSQISIDSFIGIQDFPSSLNLNNVPEGALEYSWHRGTNDNAENMIISYKPPSHSWQSGPLFSGRENVTHMGSLEIKDSMLNDTGNYTVRVDLSNGTQRATGWLEIQEWTDDPVISVNTSLVAENMDSMAAFCSTNASKVMWYVNALQVSSNDQMTISPDGKTLIMHWVHRHDMMIQCGVDSVFGVQRSKLILLTVAYGPDRVALSSKPAEFRGILSAEIGSQVQMDCTSTSSPRPKYRWIHNGSFLSSEAKLSFPSLTWGQMGRYRCIVENSMTQLTMYKDVWIQRPWQMPVIRTGFYLTGPLVVFFIVMAVLGGVYLCGILVYTLINHFCTRTNRSL